jgi:hypothetical protein
VWAIAGDYSHNHQPGRVLKAQLDGRSADIVFELTVEADTWSPSGWGRYHVTLERTGSGAFAGTYTGTFGGEPVKGTASGSFTPSAHRPVGARRAAAPGRHPRIPFRAGDLPALRRKAETPLGRALVGGVNGAMGPGLRDQLTRHQKPANQARGSWRSSGDPLR